MKYKITFTELSQFKLSEIAEYIAEDSPKRARSFIKEMKSHLQKRLSSMPLSGREVQPGIRMIPFKRYSIVYKVSSVEPRVFILDIFGGGQDWQQHI